MPINNITQTISTLPPAGARGVDVQTIFVTKQEDFQDHLQGTTVTELNTLKDQLNTRIGEINSTATTMNGYATSASSSATTATTKAGEASTSASEALTYKNQASTSATAAATSAASLTPSGILTAIKTVDGTGSGLDADLLGGVASTGYMKKTTDNTITQSILFNNGTIDSNGFAFISNTGATPSQDINVDMYNGILRIFRNNGVQPFSIGGDNTLWADNGISGTGKILTSTTPLGYSTSSLGGGTVTQATSKTTDVTLNKLCGKIVLYNSTLASKAEATFNFLNSLITEYDTVELTPIFIAGVSSQYTIEVNGIANGLVRLRLTNISLLNLSDSYAFNYLIIKGAIS